MNEVFQHNPKIAELDAELDKLDIQRQETRDKARAVKAERHDLIMAEQIVLRRLNGADLSRAELDWLAANPDKAADIKAKTKDKVGSRTPQRVGAKPIGRG